MKVLVAVLALATASGVAFAQDAKKKDGKKSSGKPVTVRMMEQNGSKESGTAKLTPMGDQTKVEVSLKGAPKGVAQPSHIHSGTCANLDPKPKQGLANVSNGKSSTTVPVKLEDLLSGENAINVHKSGDDLKTYVACGDIKQGGAAPKKNSKKQ